MLMPLCGSQQTGKFLKRREYQTTKRQQLESDIGQQSESKLGKEYDKAVYCHPVY